MGVLPAKFSRYTAVANLFIKYGGKLGHPTADGVVELPTANGSDQEAKQFAEDLEKLGPTFVKLGQLLSTRSDLLPPSYLEPLSRLQDDLEPVPAAQIYETIEKELHVRVSKAFAWFDPEPLASASLGQVHKAALHNTYTAELPRGGNGDGRTVAVKVQRPGIAKQAIADLDVLDEIAAFVDHHTLTGRRYAFAPMMQEFRKALMAELDYRQEASHLRTLKQNLSEFPRLVVPAPIDDYTSARVLTMDFVRGSKVTALNPVALVDIDREGLAEDLIRAYLHQILVDGFFHADPHPGNVFLTEDGRLALIDLGMIGHLSPSLQDKLLKLVLAVSDGRGEDAADTAIQLGEMRDGFDEDNFRRDVVDLVGRYQDVSLENFQVGRIMLQVSQAAGAHGIKPPAELTMLGKTLLNIDHVARCLAPSLEVNAVIRRHAGELMQRRLLKSASPSAVLSTVLEAKEFAEHLPRRINRVLESLAASQLKLKVEMIDEGAMMDGLQKVANRITLGLVLAALIISAAMMMRVESSFRLLGYPGFPTLLLLVAGSIGLWLVLHIVLHDQVSKKKT